MLTGEKMCRPWRRATLKCVLKVNMGIFGTYTKKLKKYMRSPNSIH